MTITQQALADRLAELRGRLHAPLVQGTFCIGWASAAAACIKRDFPGTPCRLIAGSFVMRYEKEDPAASIALGPDSGAVAIYGDEASFWGHAWLEVDNRFLADPSFGDMEMAAERGFQTDGMGRPPERWPFPKTPLVMPRQYLSKGRLFQISQAYELTFGYRKDLQLTERARHIAEQAEEIRAFVRMAEMVTA